MNDRVKYELLKAAAAKAVTMSSLELVDVINEMREAGRAELLHKNFMAKIESHPGIDSAKFLAQYKDSTGRTLKCYQLPKREAEMMVMSESLGVQTKVYDRLVELEAGAIPAPKIKAIDATAQALKLMPLAMRAARALGLDANAAAIGANQLVCKVTGQNLLMEFGSTHLVSENQETQWFTPTELGGRVKMSASQVNQLLASAGFQVKRGKIWELLTAGRPFARLYDTGQKHNSGVPVQQIKWTPATIEAARKASGQGGQGLLEV